MIGHVVEQDESIGIGEIRDPFCQIVGTVPPEAGRNDLVFLDEKLYIVGGSDSGAGYIERIEPTNLQIVTRGALNGPGYYVAGADAALWVSLSSGKSVAITICLIVPCAWRSFRS